VASTLSELDGRAWLAWSSHSWSDTGGEDHLARTATLMADIAAHVLGDPASGTAGAEGGAVEQAPDEAPDAAIDLTADLVRAIAAGHAHAGHVHADDAHHTLGQTLRVLRLHDPLRFEWQLVSMDAFFLGAQQPARVRDSMGSADAAGLAFLYIGKDRTDRLKADPWITPRFRRELVARAYLTAYALRRLAPVVAQTLLDVMRPMAG